MIDTPSCTSKPSLGCTSCQYGDWFRDAVWVFGGDSGPCCTQPNWKVRWNLKMPLSGGAAAILVWKSSKLLSEPLLSKPLLMLHQDCVLNLPQNSLPPKQPGFQQGFQPTNHRTSCQSVFATLIIRVGSRKRHSAGSPHFACGVPGRTQFWVPQQHKKHGWSQDLWGYFCCCGALWSVVLGSQWPQRSMHLLDPKRSMLGALAMRLNSSRSWPRERQSDIEYVEQFRVYQQWNI